MSIKRFKCINYKNYFLYCLGALVSTPLMVTLFNNGSLLAYPMMLIWFSLVIIVVLLPSIIGRNFYSHILLYKAKNGLLRDEDKKPRLMKFCKFLPNMLGWVIWLKIIKIDKLGLEQ